MATGTDKPIKLIPFKMTDLPSASELADNDLFMMQDTSQPLPLRRVSLGVLRAMFGGLPQVEDLPTGAVDNPEWRLEGFEGGWRIYIDTIVPEARYYLVYFFDSDQVKYLSMGYLIESRQLEAMGPLILDITVPFSNPPQPHFRIFKIQTVTHEYKGPLSDSKSAWSILRLPPDFIPAAPVLETDGYPYISYQPMEDGTFGYRITIRINAAAGEKEYIRFYEIQRQTDRGITPWPADSRWETVTRHEIKGSPGPRTVFFHNTDRFFRVGHRYRYRVVAMALNGKASAPSNVLELLLTSDTTPPDPPVFTVTSATHEISIEIEPPTQNDGEPCSDWKYIEIQYRKNGGVWAFLHYCEALQYTQVIPQADFSATFEYRGRIHDYSNPPNISAWSAPSDGRQPRLVTGGGIADRTIQAGNVGLKALTYAEIADLTIRTAKIADLGITETKIADNSISTPKLIANSVVGSKILGGTIEGAHIMGLTITGDKMAANTVSLNKLLFVPLVSAGGTAEIIATINASAEGIRIGGGKLYIDANAQFAADVVIQGILSANGGIKTSAGTERIELGRFGGGADFLRMYHTNYLTLELKQEVDEGDGHVRSSLQLSERYGDNYYGYSMIGADGLFCVDINPATGTQGASLSVGRGADALLLWDGSTFTAKIERDGKIHGSSFYLGTTQVIKRRMNNQTTLAGLLSELVAVGLMESPS